jgi:hypothetical protein
MRYWCRFHRHGMMESVAEYGDGPFWAVAAPEGTFRAGHLDVPTLGEAQALAERELKALTREHRCDDQCGRGRNASLASASGMPRIRSDLRRHPIGDIRRADPSPLCRRE